MIINLLLSFLIEGCFANEPHLSNLGVAEIPAVPKQSAMTFNAEGKRAYKAENFAQALESYTKACEQDPTMLAAKFNVACVLSRLNRQPEAISQVTELVERACVPWAQAVVESADLAVMGKTPHWGQVIKAIGQSCRAWGNVATKGVFFIARTYPAVNVSGDGVLALQLNQEIFSYYPSTGRYLQLSAETGSILAMAVTPDRSYLVYVAGKKVIVEGGMPVLLRGLYLKTLDLSTMSTSSSVQIPGDVRTVSLAVTPGRLVEVGITDKSWKTQVYKLEDDRLEALQRSVIPKSVRRTVLSPLGSGSSKEAYVRGRCSLLMRDVAEGDVPEVIIKEKGGATFKLNARYGAGIYGLPFPRGRRLD